MSISSVKESGVNERPSVLIELKMVDKLGLPLDPALAWLALKEAFKGHPHLDVYQAKISPNKHDAQ